MPYTKDTHPNKKFWDQILKRINFPRRWDDAVILSQEEFDKLDDYSLSNPTGVYQGKVWKRSTRFGNWLLCRYNSDEGFIDKYEIAIEKEESASSGLPIWML